MMEGEFFLGAETPKGLEGWSEEEKVEGGASRSSHCLDFQLQREEGGKDTKVVLDAWHWGLEM